MERERSGFSTEFVGGGQNKGQGFAGGAGGRTALTVCADGGSPFPARRAPQIFDSGRRPLPLWRNGQNAPVLRLLPSSPQFARILGENAACELCKADIFLPASKSAAHIAGLNLADCLAMRFDGMRQGPCPWSVFEKSLKCNFGVLCAVMSLRILRENWREIPSKLRVFLVSNAF